MSRRYATYKGFYRPRNPQKYEGDFTKIVYRSSWERSVCKWADLNPNIASWSSEEVVVQYVDYTGKHRRYFVDFKMTLNNGTTYLIEIKPKSETMPPKQRKKTRRYLLEVSTWATNQAKWKYAKAFAESRGWIFKVWTEDTLKAYGIHRLQR